MFEDMVKKYFNSKNITFGFIVLLFLFFIFNCKDIAIMFFASFVIACSLNPIVDKMSKKLPRGIATELVTAGILFLILLIFIPVCMVAIDQIRKKKKKLPNYIDNFDEFIFKFPFLKHFNFLADDADNLMEKLSLSSADLFNHVIDIGKIIGQSIVFLIVSIIIIFNFVSDKAILKSFYLKAFPSNMRKKAEEVGNIIADKMGGYLVALIITSLSVGIVMFVGLALLKVPYALLLSVITGVLDIIPIIGPAVALVICLIAVYESGSYAIISVISIFVLAQLIENNLVRPYIFGKVMHVHPIVIFLFLFIAAEYIGFVGVIFAPALAALVAVLFEELYLKKLD